MLETEYGTFTNNEITGQTAKEVYQEWLENKDKPPQPTEMERQQETINTLGQELAQLKLQIMMGGI